MAGAAIRIGLPPLVGMMNSHGTAWAAEAPIESRFVFWFNGNGIPERYWIPEETGRDYALTPCLAPLAAFRNDMHVVTGLDNAVSTYPGPGNGHHTAYCGLA